jgi:hypothetical protein
MFGGKGASYAFGKHYRLDNYWRGCRDCVIFYWSENKRKLFLEFNSEELLDTDLPREI